MRTKNHRKRYLALLLAVLMVVGMLPIDAVAAEGSQEPPMTVESVSAQEIEVPAGELETVTTETEPPAGESETVTTEMEPPAGESETVTTETEPPAGESETVTTETEPPTGESETVTTEMELPAEKSESATEESAQTVPDSVESSSQPGEAPQLSTEAQAFVEAVDALDSKAQIATRAYTVRHIRQSLDGSYDNDSLAVSETLSGTIGEKTQALANRSYEGFQALIPEQVTIAESGDITVSVYYARQSFTTFFETGDEAQDFHETFLYEAMQSVPIAPKIPGKIFSGWIYYDAAGNRQSWTPGTQQAGDLTVYAEYDIPFEAEYVINYWYQNATDEMNLPDGEKTYTLFDTETKTQATNTSVVYEGASRERTYKKYNQSKTETMNAGKLVKADGTTVVNVYYDRPVMTMTFVYYDLSTGKESSRKSYQAIFEHSSEGIVPPLDRTYQWSGGRYPDHILNAIADFGEYNWFMQDDYNIEFHARELMPLFEKQVYISIHTQNPDGTWTKDMETIISHGNVTNLTNVYHKTPYVPTSWGAYHYWTNSLEDFTTDVRADNPVLFEDPYPANSIFPLMQRGELVNDYDNDGIAYLHCYRELRDFKLTFLNADNPPVMLLYGAPLAYAKESIDAPVKPASVPEHYVFAGWYTTADFQEGTEVDLNAKIGQDGMFLYAKWQESSVTITVEGNGATSELPASVSIPRYFSAQQNIPMLPSKDGFWFGGWYKDADFTLPFDVNESIAQDITIYAKWNARTSAGWTVKYVDTNGKVLAEADTGTGNLYEVLIRYAKDIPNYHADYSSKNLTLLVSDADNELAFIYSLIFMPPTPTPTGNLTVSKTVSGSGASQTKDFTFTVTLSDTTITGTFGDMTFHNGVATFTLKHNESKTATELPAGTAYTVTESDNNGYTVTANNTAETTATGTIPAGETAAAAFNNHRSGGGGGSGTSDPSPSSSPSPATVTLTAAKTLDGKAPTGREYSFILKDENGAIVQTVQNSGGSIAFAPLSFSKTGTYTYTISEAAGTDGKITYDTAVYTVVLEVTRSGDYKAAVRYEKDGQAYDGTPAFANVTKPTNPADPTTPVKPTDPTTPVKPVDPTKPSDSGAPNNPNTPQNSAPSDKPVDKVPQTGDASNIGLWIGLAGLSLLAMAAVLFGKKRKSSSK